MATVSGTNLHSALFTGMEYYTGIAPLQSCKPLGA